MRSKSYKIIYRMVITAMFIALCYIGCEIRIPLGTSKVHLGNFVCILAGLLLDGLSGGIAGSVGMVLNDIFHGYPIDTIIRTLIVKFALGYFSGTLFRYIINKKKDVSNSFTYFGGFFFIIFLIFTAVKVFYDGQISLGDKSFKAPLEILVASLIISLGFFALQIFIKKFNNSQKVVFFVVISSCILNIVLEFLLKIPLKALLTDMSLKSAFIYAITSLPSALITCIITSIILSIVFLPIYKATKKVNHLNNLDI